ncbi:MAG TPA: hypothetical protein VEB43_06195 [Anaeromyxobacter sp.]|nr:hypothetical protein [Anaeromyxobacter sp.]
MPVHPRMLLAAAVAVALCAGPAAAQEPNPQPAPQGDGDFGAKQMTLDPIRQLEPQPVPAVEPPQDENVWSHGVPEAERRAAEVLFLEGNKLLRESLTLLAVSKYREALTHWNHPNIHFNLAIALMSMDQPVETYEHLQQATRYGAKPLAEERFHHARNYLALLEKQLARVELRCDVPEGVVELDGHQLFATPGEWNGLVRAGRHTVVARRDGYVTNQAVRVFEGGQTVRLQLQLKTLAQLTETKRRWSAWKPWAVVGGGATVLGAGAALLVGGNEKIRQYDRQSKLECREEEGFCTSEPPALARLRKDGRVMQRAGVVAGAAGGAVLVTGAILVFANRGRSHVRTYDEIEGAAPAPPPPRVEISPLVTPDAPGLAVRLRFR